MDKLKRSVDSLQTIYAIIIALAISKIFATIFEDNNWDNLINSLTDNLPAILSFFLLMVPFYHGMNRHFDMCYVEKNNKDTQGALIIDFFVFCIEASLFFIFANFITSGLNSFIILGIVLIIDVLWGFSAHLIHYKKLRPSVIWWSIINSIAILFGYLNFVTQDIFTPEIKEWNFAIIMIIRTVVDYITSWSFYFPKEDS